MAAKRRDQGVYDFQATSVNDAELISLVRGIKIMVMLIWALASVGAVTIVGVVVALVWLTKIMSPETKEKWI